MIASRPGPPRPRFLRTILRQLLVLLVAIPLLAVSVGFAGALAFLCGAGCSVVPQAYFAWRMQRAAGLSAARSARAGLAAEAGKFLLSVAGFAAVFALVRPAQPLLVFVGFAAMWLLQLWQAARLLRQPQ